MEPGFDNKMRVEKMHRRRGTLVGLLSIGKEYKEGELPAIGKFSVHTTVDYLSGLG